MVFAALTMLETTLEECSTRVRFYPCNIIAEMV